MDRVEAVRLALLEVGEVSSEELAALVRSRFGIRLDVKFVPVLRETLRQQELRDAFYRRRAEQAAQGASAAGTEDASATQ